MPYRVDCYIPTEADEPTVYATLTAAEEDRHELEGMQPENIYKIVQID